MRPDFNQTATQQTVNVACDRVTMVLWLLFDLWAVNCSNKQAICR